MGALRRWFAVDLPPSVENHVCLLPPFPFAFSRILPPSVEGRFLVQRYFIRG